MSDPQADSLTNQHTALVAAVWAWTCRALGDPGLPRSPYFIPANTMTDICDASQGPIPNLPAPGANYQVCAAAHPAMSGALQAWAANAPGCSVLNALPLHSSQPPCRLHPAALTLPTMTVLALGCCPVRMLPSQQLADPCAS